ncbi:MAG TPA: nitroreductase family deazaflavin-dependent oxidoreductase [Anaerolineae bacterium]|nr:nitroreductase family deazaflavin-dependent oxidoreductase [Anaerolineae bacterium]HID84016.1 nitroreductase family deazaflavin-dependent oxidoreductase [Anaerolineales bacterium]HIQ09019.1 nitroreductase family deazaflavin-dependent oxidoreductase [Anaerolineaceae bacterium]
MSASDAVPRLPNPPRGWKAIPWRLPIWIYRLGLGGLLGRRFLLLHHIGCKTGKRRQNVLEVICYDPHGPTFYVASGFGRRSHWFRNILAHPEVEIQVGWRRYRAVAEVLDPEQAAEILQAYAQKHPIAFRELARLIGILVPQDEEAFRRLAQAMPVVAFRVQ